MKKKSLLIIAAALISIGCFVPFNKQEAVIVNASYFNCYRQLMTVQNWKNWFPQISKVYKSDSSLYKLIKSSQGIKLSIPGTIFLIKQHGSAELNIKKTTEGGGNSYTFTIVPGGSVLSAAVIVNYKTTVFKSVFRPQAVLEETDIGNFKKFMESVQLYYGFNIKRDFMNEKRMVVLKKTVPADQIYTEGANLRQQLSDYINHHHLTRAGSLMVQYNNRSGDSIEMLMGFPIDRQVPSEKGLLYMYIPATTVLIADFKGTYNDRKKIYNAMSAYLQDKYLHAKIAPYEEFVSGFPAGVNDITNFRLTYAIF